MTCDCGKTTSNGALQCKECRSAVLKKIAKYAIVLGILLGFICQHLPAQYHDVCKAVAGALSSC